MEESRLYCNFCTHLEHGKEKCSKCRCKGKLRWWQGVLNGLGNAIGNAKFGGN